MPGSEPDRLRLAIVCWRYGGDGADRRLDSIVDALELFHLGEGAMPLEARRLALIQTYIADLHGDVGLGRREIARRLGLKRADVKEALDTLERVFLGERRGED
jgi:hypothetical protein